MADTNSLFQDFNDKIKLSSSKEAELRVSRDSVRDTIKKWMSDNDKSAVSFCGQGSFMIKTVTNPLSGGDYDIDDGIYLSEYKDSEKDTWPTPSTVHNWVASSVDDKTQEDVIKKNTCVRVVYAHGYHIDLPVYIQKDGLTYLAHCSKDWIHSDPKEFTNWFLEKIRDNDEQLRRNVRYLKAWRDHKSISLKSIEITILAAEQYDPAINRDDKSLHYTVQNIINALELSFKCEKPVAPFEDLFSDTSATKRESILNSLKSLKKKLEKAIAEDDVAAASEHLISVFGDRFPKGTTTAKAAFVATSTAGVLKNDGRSG